MKVSILLTADRIYRFVVMPSQSPQLEVIGSKSTGSAIAEAFLVLAEVPFTRTEWTYAEPGPIFDRLLKLNHLGQVPTFVWPDGQVTAETLALAMYLHQQKPHVGLLPASARELRWLTYIVTAIYPTFTYGDDPAKWVGGESDASRQLRATTDIKKKEMWQQLEAEARAPFFGGEQMSAIDIYIKVMSHWRPGRKWFEAECPKLVAIAEKVTAEPRLQALWQYHFST